MTRRVACMAVLMVAGMVSGLYAQAKAADPAVQKVADQYQAAFNKGDVQALAALYTADAWRVGPDGQLLQGRPAIQQYYSEGFAGPVKGAKLTLHNGAIQTIAPDVSLMEGTYEVTGGTQPGKGRYVNTLKREGAEWKLASVVVVPAMPPQ